jgi:hypothetical protein
MLTRALVPVTLCSLALSGCPGDAPPAIDAGRDAPIVRPDAPIVRPDAGPPPPPTDEPNKGPWVMQPTTTSALVRWESQLEVADASIEVTPEAGGAALPFAGTSTETTVRLSYGVDLRLDDPDVPGTYFVNEARAEGLSPATCYRYVLARYPEHGGRFCTMHAPDDHTTPITFYALGDTSPALAGTTRILSNTDPSTTEMTIHVGDIQYYTTLIETQEVWFDLMQPMLEANAFLPCIGNHEMEGADGVPFEFEDIYLRLFDHPGGEDGVNAGTDGTLWYHFETGGVHFFSLSTEHAIEIGSPQHDWLLATLAAVEAEPTYRFSIVYLHRPWYSYGDYSPNAGLRSALEPVVRDHRVPLVLAGHMHGYERFEIDYPTPGGTGLGHVTYVTTGAGGFAGTASTIDENLPTDTALAALRVADGTYLQAMVVSIVPDATSGGDRIEASTVDDLGMERDAFVITIPPAP